MFNTIELIYFAPCFSRNTLWKMRVILNISVLECHPGRCVSCDCLPNGYISYTKEAYVCLPCWNNTGRNYMMTSSNGNIFRVTGPLCGEFTGPGEFLAQRPVTRSFDVFFDLWPNKRLSNQPWGWWFETLSWSLWRHCNKTLSHADGYPVCYTTRLRKRFCITVTPHECQVVSNQRQVDCLFIRLAKSLVTKATKLRITGLCWIAFTQDF